MSLNNSTKYYYIILKRPYDYFETDNEARLFLSDVFKMKLSGYKEFYPYGILPISSYDFYCDHLIVCKLDRFKLTPISSWRTINYETCQRFGIEFPFIDSNLKGQEGTYPSHIKAIKAMIEELVKNDRNFFYQGGWTTAQNLSKRDKLIAIEAGACAVYFYYTQEKAEAIFTSANAKFKVDKTVKTIGFQDFYLNEKALPPVNSNSFFGDPMALLYLKEFTNNIKSRAERFQVEWDHRQEISTSNSAVNNINAA